MYEVMSENVSPEGWMHKWACVCLEIMADEGIVFRVGHDRIIIDDPDVVHEDALPTASINEGPAMLAPYVFRIVSRWLRNTSTEMLGILMRVADDGQLSSERTPIHRVYGRHDWLQWNIRDMRTIVVRVTFGALVARIFDMIMNDHRTALVEFDDDISAEDTDDDDDWMEEEARAQAATNDPRHQQTALASVHAPM